MFGPSRIAAEHREPVELPSISSKALSNDSGSAHPHASLHLPALSRLQTVPIIFEQCTKVDAIFAKLISFIGTSSIDTAKLDAIKVCVKGVTEGQQSLPNPVEWWTAIGKC
jgi:hypothetical protein